MHPINPDDIEQALRENTLRLIDLADRLAEESTPIEIERSDALLLWFALKWTLRGLDADEPQGPSDG